jgi:hypothetical protein
MLDVQHLGPTISEAEEGEAMHRYLIVECKFGSDELLVGEWLILQYIRQFLNHWVGDVIFWFNEGGSKEMLEL